MSKEQFKITETSKKDLEEILKLQKISYRQEAEIYQDYSIPPLQQSYEEIVEECKNKVVLKAEENDRVIGSVRASKDKNTCYIGRLIVHPDFQNQGIGKRLIEAIENKFNDIKRFELFTGHRSDKNLHLYKKLGYEEFKGEKFSDNIYFIYLEKKK